MSITEMETMNTESMNTMAITEIMATAMKTLKAPHTHQSLAIMHMATRISTTVMVIMATTMQTLNSPHTHQMYNMTAITHTATTHNMLIKTSPTVQVQKSFAKQKMLWLRLRPWLRKR
jgi:hypothetical protein